MLAQNLAHRAILAGHTARFVSTAAMLGGLATQDGPASLRRLKHDTTPPLIVIDEIAYMSHGQGYSDLLFQAVSHIIASTTTRARLHRRPLLP